MKLSLPNLRSVATSQAINASLVRLANDDKGWQLAQIPERVEKVDDYTIRSNAIRVTAPAGPA